MMQKPGSPSGEKGGRNAASRGIGRGCFLSNPYPEETIKKNKQRSVRIMHARRPTFLLNSPLLCIQPTSIQTEYEKDKRFCDAPSNKVHGGTGAARTPGESGMAPRGCCPGRPDALQAWRGPVRGVSAIHKERILMVILKETWEGLGTTIHKSVCKSPTSATRFQSLLFTLYSLLLTLDS